MDVKYQIFISSTYLDLVEERDSAIAAILKIGHIPIGMEMFKAEDVDSWEVIKRTIESADYYVVIVGHKYGSIAKNGKSFTEMEYDYAIKLGIPTLAFIIDDNASIQANKIDNTDEKRQKLQKFKKKLEKKNRDTWKDSSELSYKLISALTGQFNINPRPGWIRNEKLFSNSIDELTRLSKENSELRDRIKNLEERVRDKDSNRKPLLKVSFSSELNFSINIPKERIRVEKAVTDKSYNEKIMAQTYNKSLSSEEQYNIYNKEIYSFKYAELNAKQVKILLSNIGNIKATVVEVEVIVPNEIAVIYRLNKHHNIKLNEPNDCIDEYNDQEMQQVDINKICANYYIANWATIYKNSVRINLNDLMHTKSREVTVYLLPLKKGEYNFEVRYLCNEYPEKIVEKIPVKIS